MGNGRQGRGRKEWAPGVVGGWRKNEEGSDRGGWRRGAWCARAWQRDTEGHDPREREGALPRSFATSLSKRDPRVRPCSTGASR